jgi:hypothetical protein
LLTTKPIERSVAAMSILMLFLSLGLLGMVQPGHGQGLGQGQPGSNARNAFNIFYVVLRGWSLCFTPFLRENFGIRSFGGPAAIAFLILAMMSGNCPPMQVYLALWILAVICRWVQAWQAFRRGALIHSYSAGDPECLTKGKFVRRYNTAVFVAEPLFCFVIGLMFLSYSEILGVFIMLGCVPLIAMASMDRQAVQRQLMDQRDGEVTMRGMAALRERGLNDF